MAAVVQRPIEHRAEGSRAVFIVLGIGVTLLAALGAALVAISAIVGATPPGVAFGVQDGASDLPLSSDVQVAITGWDAHIQNAALYEAPIGSGRKPRG